MKYTKQLRWLIFLLVPLITLLTIHFVVPVSFIFESTPLVQDKMLENNISSQQLSIRSSSITTQITITNYLNKTTQGLKKFIKLLSMNQYQTLEINLENVQLNNCFTYALNLQNILNNTSEIELVSMWFATGVDQTQNLSPGQQQLLQRYKNIEPFVPPLFTDPHLMHSLAFYLVSDSSDSLYVEYPSRISEKCSNLSNPVIDSVYTATVALADGETAPFLENSSDGSRLLSLCTPSQLNSLTVVSCLRLNLFTLGTNLLPLFQGRSSNNFTTLLIMSTDFHLSSLNKNPQIVLMFNSDNVTILYDNAYENQYFSDSVLSRNPTLQNSHLYLKQLNYTSFFIIPIFMGKTIPLRLILEFEAKNTTAVEGVRSQVVTSLLIPVLVLNVLAITVTICIIKSLLDSVDKELFDLDSRCKFIVKGDIEVQIPKHFGTKDIRQVYDEVQVLNKLHRFSTQSYFSGHFAQKIPKYFEALQLIDKLNYDKGNIFENIGQTYMYVQQWSKAQRYLIKCVDNIIRKIELEYGPLQAIFQLKKNHQKLPSKYKQCQLVLIRRIFKLCYVFLNQLEFGLTFQKIQELDKQEREDYIKRRTEYTDNCYKYLSLLRKIFYGHFGFHAEGIIMLICEAKWMSDLGRQQDARKNIVKMKEYLKQYTHSFDDITKALNIKGSESRLLRKKHILTTHSRVQPDILWMFRDFNEAKIIQNQPFQPSNFEKMFKVLCSHLQSNIMTNIVMYLTIFEIRKVLVALEIDVTAFESTQLFRQVIPFKTLHYGSITSDIEKSLLRYAYRGCQGLQRQFVFVFDCMKPKKNRVSQDKALIKYHKDRVHHIFGKIVSKTDRVSVVKYNTKSGVTVECGLMLKETNQVLRHMLYETIKERHQKTFKQEDGLLEAVKRVFHRVKRLKSEKVLIFYFRQIRQYFDSFQKMNQKRSLSPTKSPRPQSIKSSFKRQKDFQNNLGNLIVDLMQDEQVRNMKMILECSQYDNREEFLQFFDLKDINRRIWRATGGINLNNNVVYIMSDVSEAQRAGKEKGEIDRLLMSKSQHYADNSMFIL